MKVIWLRTEHTPEGKVRRPVEARLIALGDGGATVELAGERFAVGLGTLWAQPRELIEAVQRGDVQWTQ